MATTEADKQKKIRQIACTHTHTKEFIAAVYIPNLFQRDQTSTQLDVNVDDNILQ